MKKRKVLISALLAAAVVSTATLASCGDKEENKKTTTSEQGGGDQTTTSGVAPTSTTSGAAPTSTTSGAAPTSTTSGAAPTSTTSGATPTSTSTDVTPTSTSEVVTDKATLRLHYNGDNLDEVSESIEYNLTLGDADGKYAEIDQTKLTVRDTYREFKGWYTDKDLTVAATADEKTYIDADIDLYAKWESVGAMTTFELNATKDLSAGALANDYKKGIFRVAANTNVRSASPTGDYASGYTQELQGNGNMQVFVSPLEDTTLSVIYCQRSTGSVSTAGLFEVVDGVVQDTAIDTIYCSVDGTASGAKMGSNETGKKDFTLTGGKTYLIKGTGGTCSILDMSCKYEVTPSPVESIEVISAPVVNLIEGEQYDSSTAAGKINFLNGTSEDLKADQFEVDYSALNTKEEGVYTVKIKYSPEEYIYNKLKGETYTADIQVKVFSIKEIILGFNETVSEKGTYNGTLVNHTVKTIYKSGDQYDPSYLSVTAHATLGEGDEAEEYTKLLKSDEYDIDMRGEEITLSGDVVVTYTTNEKPKTASYAVYVVNALDVTKDTYDVKVDAKYTGEIGAYSSGKYNFQTINQAMNFLRLYQADANYEEKAINLEIAAGYYNEKVEFDLPNMTVKGAGRVNKALDAGFDWTDEEKASKTIIEWNSIKGIADESGYIQQTDSTATVAVRETAVNFYISGVTISNDFNSFQDFITYFGDRPNETQALALLVQADKFVMKDSDLHGYQDTLETFTGRQVFIDTLISGTTDFIFGTNNATYFYNCEIRCISPAQKKDGYIQYNVDGGYVTAFKGNNKGADDAIDLGAVFDGCTFTAEKYVRSIDGYTAQIKLEDKSYAEYDTDDYDGKYFTRVDTTKVEAPVAGTTYYTFTVAEGVATFTPAGEITAWAENTQYATAEDITTGNTAIARPWGTNASVVVENSTLEGHISLLDYDYTYKEVAATAIKTKDVLTTQYEYFTKVDTTKTAAPESGKKYATLADGTFTIVTVTEWAAGTEYYVYGGTRKVNNDVKAENYHATKVDDTAYTYVENPAKKAILNADYYYLNADVYTLAAKGTDFDSEKTYYTATDPKDSKNRRYVTMSGNSPMTSTIYFAEYNNQGTGAVSKTKPAVSIDDSKAYKYLEKAVTQDDMFGLHNGNVAYDGTWRGVITIAGKNYGKVYAKDANLVLNLIGENNSYYADANITSAFAANTQYYVENGGSFEAVDVNKYAFKEGTDYYYDKVVYTPVAAGSVQTKAVLTKQYDALEKVDKTKTTAPEAGKTYYTLAENVFTVVTVTEWAADTDYYVFSATRKVGNDVKSNLYHTEPIADSTSLTYVATPEQKAVTNAVYYEQDGKEIPQKSDYDSTKTYYNKGTEKALVESTTVDKTIKYYSKDGDNYTELEFNSTNFNVTGLETPVAGTTYYTSSGVITLSQAFYSGLKISEEEFTMLYDEYRKNNPSIADFELLGIYADAAGTTEYAYPTLVQNNNQIYVEIGLANFVDTYSYLAGATNTGWTVAEAESTNTWITPTVNSTIHKPADKVSTDVECTQISTQKATSYVQSPTLGVGTKTVNVTIFGGTHTTNDARVKVVAYNKAGEQIAEVKALKMETGGAKSATHFYTDDAAKDTKGNYTIPVVSTTDDIAYIRVFGCGKTGDALESKSIGFYSIDVEAIYDTTGMIGKNYVLDIDYPAVAKPWKLADGTMSDTVQNTTATFVDGMITADCSVSGSKVYSRPQGWAQFVTGAKLTFKVAAGATVSFKTYTAGTVKYSVNGGEAVTPSGKDVSFTVEHASVIVIEAAASDYISDITVTFGE